jgi:alginate O-acetyltransferase complex protein AlgI
MLFNSPEFVLGFLPASLAGFFLLGRFAGRDWAMRWLLAAGLFFYGWWNAKFALLLAGSIIANHWAASAFANPPSPASVARPDAG